MPCFWTHLEQAEQQCEASAGANDVAAVIQKSEFNQFTRVGDWFWNGAPLYAPAAPAAPSASREWVSAFGPDSVIYRVRNTGVPGGTDIPSGDFTFDGALGRITTNGAIEVAALDTSGGSGAYTASGINADFDTVDYSAQYAGLSSGYKYPAWVEDYALYIPPRRLPVATRVVVDMGVNTAMTTTETRIYADPGNAVLFDGVRPTSPIVATTDPSTGALLAYITPAPFEASETISTSLGLSMSIKPTGGGNITMNGYFQGQIGVAEPSPVDAYIDDLEFFAGAFEDTFSFPAAGGGDAFPNIRLPVWYRDDQNGWGDYDVWGIGGYGYGDDGVTYNTAVLDSMPIYDAGAWVGTLRTAATGDAICRVAIVRTGGGA